MIHGDLARRNIIVQEDGPIYILDWASAGQSPGRRDERLGHTTTIATVKDLILSHWDHSSLLSCTQRTCFDLCHSFLLLNTLISITGRIPS